MSKRPGHNLTLTEVHEKWPDLKDKAFHPVNPGSVEAIKRVNESPPPEPESQAQDEDPEMVDYATQAYDKLGPAERKYFDLRFEGYYQRVERDPDLLADINSLVFAEIDLLKFRELSQTRYLNQDFSKAKIYEDIIKSLEDRRRKLMDSLGLSKAEKTKNKTQIKSTVSALIAGFENEIELISPEQLEAAVMDEQKGLAVMHERVNRYIVANAPDIEASKEDADEPPLDFESVVRDADLPF